MARIIAANCVLRARWRPFQSQKDLRAHFWQLEFLEWKSFMLASSGCLSESSRNWYFFYAQRQMRCKLLRTIFDQDVVLFYVAANFAANAKCIKGEGYTRKTSVLHWNTIKNQSSFLTSYLAAAAWDWSSSSTLLPLVIVVQFNGVIR